MTKPSPTDATTKLDGARKAVTDHLKDLIGWRSGLLYPSDAADDLRLLEMTGDVVGQNKRN